MVAVVAVMAKLVKVGYACQMKGVPYDPNYPVAPSARRPTAPIEEMPISESMAAPVSRREANRRKNAVGATVRGQASKSVVIQPLSSG